MKLKTKLLVALTFLAAACGHRGSKSVATRTEPLPVEEQELRDERRELELIVKAENAADGSITTKPDVEKITEIISSRLKDLLGDESMASAMADVYGKDKDSYLVFKHAFNFAINKLSMSKEDAIAYAKETEKKANEAKDERFEAGIKSVRDEATKLIDLKEKDKADQIETEIRMNDTSEGSISPERMSEIEAEALKRAQKQYLEQLKVASTPAAAAEALPAAEAPKVDAPKVDAPKVDEGKKEAPKADAAPVSTEGSDDFNFLD